MSFPLSTFYLYLCIRKRQEMIEYIDFGIWLRKQLNARVQKIAVDAGFTCPNRDGKVGFGGCSFCNNKTFNPSYCDNRKSISEQLEDGKKFFSRKYPDMKYIAYFQAFSNTYAPLERLKRLYEEALSVDGVIGLSIATRPDCLDTTTLDYLSELSRRTFLILEIGIESANDATLRLINRGHNFECSKKAITEANRRGIITCGHIIFGLPGEDENEILSQAETISSLPLDILKIHQLQIVKGTKMADDYKEKPFRTFSVDEYIDLIINYISRLRKDLVLERFVSQSPKKMVIAPKWGLKNQEFTELFLQKMKERE